MTQMPEDPWDAAASHGLLATADLQGAKETWRASLHELSREGRLRLDIERTDGGGVDRTSAMGTEALCFDVYGVVVAAGGRCATGTAVVRMACGEQTVDSSPNQTGVWLCLFEHSVVATTEVTIVELDADGAERTRRSETIYEHPKNASRSRLAELIFSVRINLPGRLGLPHRSADY